jgi:hypothetical protein
MLTTRSALVPESLFRERITSGVAGGVLVPETNNHTDPLKINYELGTNRYYFLNFCVFVNKNLKLVESIQSDLFI